MTHKSTSESMTMNNLDALLQLIECRLGCVILKLEALDMRIGKMATNMNDLIAAVQRNNDVGDSAIVLLKGIAQKLKDAGTDAAKLAELTSALNSQADEFATAIIENTPVENPPPVDNPPPVEPPPVA